MAAGDIILGDGAFFINNVQVGLCRGGGQFTVEREYRVIEADGDFGPVKGRIRKIKSTPKITMNLLELTPGRMELLYPATILTGTKLEADENVEPTDYVTVKFVGTTADGRDVIIIVENAINMDNIDLQFADKEEVVAGITYTGTYLDTARTDEPWSVEILA